MSEILGCDATYRIAITGKCGTPVVAYIENYVERATWERCLDEVSRSEILLTEMDADCCALIENMRPWQFEIVILRNGFRVWEGPIVEIEYTPEGIVIHGADVLAHFHARIIRNNYNVNEDLADFAHRLILDSFPDDEPCILPYINKEKCGINIQREIDSEDECTTLWSEIKNLFNNQPLDIFTVGRSITLRCPGEYPLVGVLRDNNFVNGVKVIDRGRYYASKIYIKGSGVTGVYPPDGQEDALNPPGYCKLERVISDSTVTTQAYADQIAKSRWQYSQGAGLAVETPQGALLSPDTAIPMEHFTPGVLISVEIQSFCRKVTQQMRLKKLVVTVRPSGESVGVSLIPAQGSAYESNTTGENITGSF